jgi:ribosome maturation factor RimP
MAGQRKSAAGKPSGQRAARPPRPPRERVTPVERPSGADRAAHASRLRAVVEPVILATGYDLEALSVSRVGRKHLVRIAVDSDTGVDLDAVADLSRQISAALDAVEESGDELIAGEYELEVGSPGVDRALTEPRHWRRNIGRLVQVRVGERQLTGRVSGTDDAGVTFDVDGVAQQHAYDQLGPGHVQIEFKRLAELDDGTDVDELEDEDEDEEGEDVE